MVKKSVKKKKKKAGPSKKPAAKSPAVPEKKPVKITTHPTAGPKVTDFEDALDRQLAGEPPRRPRGRPRKQPEPEPAPPPQLTQKAVQGAVSLPFVLWAETNKLEQLKLKDSEAVELAESVHALLEYYAPNLPPVVLLWSNFSLITFSIMQPRLETIRKIKNQKTNASLSTSTGSGGSEPAGTQAGTPASIQPGQNIQTFPGPTEPQII